MSPKVSRASEARPGTQLSRNRGPGSAAHHFVVRCVRDTCFAIIALFLAGLISAHAQPADTVLLNGKIVQYGAAPAEALAVRDGKIMAVGTTADIRALAGSNTRAIDLDGSTVIAGLIDSHIHAIRAGLTFTTEVHWIGARSLADALGRIRAAAEKRAEGILADRRRRLDRASVCRRPPSHAGGDRCRSARP